MYLLRFKHLQFSEKLYQCNQIIINPKTLLLKVQSKSLSLLQAELFNTMTMSNN